ncbi:MAG: exopolyphosphatase [Proteobacteria bacterium]|nr:exopolyphosphatase [Pseudomonadota bacterium]
MRIVTRPDFDGIVCAVLLLDAETIDTQILWTEPGEIQNNSVDINHGDIMANLPYDDRCLKWFDHHISNQINKPFNGAFQIAPSAARVIYDHYRTKLTGRYEKLIKETDKIDAALLSMNEVCYPENYPYVLLSMTITNRDKADEAYWNKLVGLLRKRPIEAVMEDTDVKEKCEAIIKQNTIYKDILQKYTTLNQHIAITDLRSFDKAPFGNRFLVYALFPETTVSIRVRHADNDKNKIIMSVGHNIFNQNCRVNIGLMLSAYNGGGHKGAGACSFDAVHYDQYINEIIDILIKN